jgi:antitoxin component YwqK of YwqJK toxin-antitoxin module
MWRKVLIVNSPFFSLTNSFKSLLFFLLFTVLSCTPKTSEKKEKLELEISENLIESLQQGDFLYKKHLYPTGQIKMEGNELDGKREGKWVSWYENGNIWSETWFKADLKDGITVVWLENGSKYYEGEYHDDNPTGKWTFYDESGNIIKEIQY